MSKTKMTVKQWLRKNAKGLGVCEQIQKATKKGYKPAELIGAGLNKNTVYRQRREALAA